MVRGEKEAAGDTSQQQTHSLSKYFSNEKALENLGHFII